MKKKLLSLLVLFSFVVSSLSGDSIKTNTQRWLGVGGTLKSFPSTKEAGIRKPSIDDYTKLLLHCNGTDGSTSFPDSSIINPKTVTAYGDAQIDTAQYKFGGASGLFDGTGDYLSVPDDADWFFDTGDFTIDLWIRYTSIATTKTFLGQYVDLSNRWIFSYSSGAVIIYVASGGVAKAYYVYTTTPNLNQWYHYALVRNGTNLYLFIDGTNTNWSANTPISTNSMPDLATVLKIGTEGVNDYNGWEDEIRISKGIARWITNFTPPTEEY